MSTPELRTAQDFSGIEGLPLIYALSQEATTEMEGGSLRSNDSTPGHVGHDQMADAAHTGALSNGRATVESLSTALEGLGESTSKLDNAKETNGKNVADLGEVIRNLQGILGVTGEVRKDVDDANNAAGKAKSEGTSKAQASHPQFTENVTKARNAAFEAVTNANLAATYLSILGTDGSNKQTIKDMESKVHTLVPQSEGYVSALNTVLETTSKEDDLAQINHAGETIGSSCETLGAQSETLSGVESVLAGIISQLSEQSETLKAAGTHVGETSGTLAKEAANLMGVRERTTEATGILAQTEGQPQEMAGLATAAAQDGHNYIGGLQAS